MISITGASGKTGRAVIRALVARNAPVRALVHLEERVGTLAAMGVAEVELADLTDMASLEGAFAGSSVVYHVCPNMRPDEEEIGQRVITACKRAGVEGLIYHSVLHPQIEGMPHHWAKLRVEERLIESGLSFSVLQPAAYMQNLQAHWKSVVEEGVLEIPYAAATRLGMVDLEDVAEVAALVSTEAGHAGAIYELCGPEVMDQREVATVLSECLGRPVEIRVQEPDLWALRARESGLSDYAIDSLLAMFSHYERHGFWGSPQVLSCLLQRPATRLMEVVERWLERRTLETE
jgi:uncharacterized protein YbjT (DUF2867 family)